MKEYNDEDLLMLSGLHHFAFCKRRWALVHLENQWEDNVKTVMNPIGTVNYTAVTDERTAGVKVKAYLKNDVIITDGSGTKQNPYTISN